MRGRPSPSVSVIIPTRDRPQLLADALASVARQVRPALEVRVGDDGGGRSADGVQVPGLLQLVWLPLDLGQPGAARNAAAAGARGDVLAFLDDDDIWYPDHLEGLVTAFEDPAVGFAWRDSIIIREEVSADGTRRELDRRRLARDWDDARMRSDDYLPPSAWGMRRAVFEALGGFDESFRTSEDWDLVLRAHAVTRVRRVPGATVEVRLRESGNASADFSPERLENLRRLAERHGFETPPPRTFWGVAGVVGEA
jgi:glycosyltransferase involved in cell wall biosynthesis